MMTHQSSSKSPVAPKEFAFVLRYREELGGNSKPNRVIVSLNYTHEKSDWRFTDLESAFEKIRNTISAMAPSPHTHARKH